jgi:hypothetical protein
MTRILGHRAGVETTGQHHRRSSRRWNAAVAGEGHSLVDCGPVSEAPRCAGPRVTWRIGIPRTRMTCSLSRVETADQGGAKK